MRLGLLRALWRRLFHGWGADRQLDAELESYVRLLAEEKLNTGVSGAEARRAALLETGGVEQVKEQVRAARAGAGLEVLIRDVRHGFRTLLRSPGFAAVSVLAVGLGVGSTVAIFSVVDAVLLRPLPYGEPERLAVVLHRGDGPVSPANFVDWAAASGETMELGAAEYWTPSLAGDGSTEKVYAMQVTPNLLPLIGVAPALGRHLAEGAAASRDVVMSWGLWQRRYGGDPGVIGRSLRLNGLPYRVVGVMPEGFRFAPFWATRAELWAPASFEGRLEERTSNSLRVFARLRPGVGLETARVRLATITDRLEAEYPGTNRDVTVTLLHEKVVGETRPALLVLLGAVTLVLLIACANVAHMLLARATSRQREVALRKVVGASRARLVRQFLTESLVLSGLGGALGWLLAWLGVRVLGVAAARSVPRMEEVALDTRVLLFALAVTLLTGVLFGIAPARQAARKDLGEILREGERGSTSGSDSTRLRGFLIASEFALAVMLLTGAGLMVRSFVAVQSIDPGFDAHSVLSLEVAVSGTAHAQPGRRGPFFELALERLRAMPGVTSVGAINHLPLAGDVWGRSFHVEGRPLPLPGEAPSATYRVVLPGYMETMRIEMASGRSFQPSDNRAAPGVVIVNETLANRFWPNESPLGRRITLGSGHENVEWMTVVGVSRNAVRSNWAAPPAEELYLPYLQNLGYLESAWSTTAYMTVVLRVAGDPSPFAPRARAVIRDIDPNVAVSNVKTLEHVVADATSPWRFYTMLLGSFAGVALAIAAIGVYGVMSYSVARRTHEIGIRLALGARREAVLALVVRQTLWRVGAGAVAGIAGARLLTGVMSSMLYGVTPTDPATFGGVLAVLCGVALAATCIPVLRAMRRDPLQALRES